MQKLNEGKKSDESMIFSLYMDEPGKTIKMYGTTFRIILRSSYILKKSTSSKCTFEKKTLGTFT